MREDLAEQIRKDLGKFNETHPKRGGKYFSRAEISKQYEVSLSTVSHAVGKLLQEGALNFIPGKGYFIENSTKKKIQKIGVLMTGLSAADQEKVRSNHQEVSGNYDIEIYLNLIKCIYGESRSLTFLQNDLLREPSPSEILENGLNSLLTVSYRWTKDLCRQWIKSEMPYISLNRHWDPELAALNYVDFDQPKMIAEAIEKLSKLGHKEIAVVTEQHCMNYMQAEAIQILINQGKANLIPKIWIFDEGEGASDRLLKKSLELLRGTKRPTAFLMWPHRACSKFIQELEKKSLKVPRDLAVITIQPKGYQSHYSAFEYDSFELVSEGLRFLNDYKEDKTTATQIKIEYRFNQSNETLK